LVNASSGFFQNLPCCETLSRVREPGLSGCVACQVCFGAGLAGGFGDAGICAGLLSQFGTGKTGMTLADGIVKLVKNVLKIFTFPTIVENHLVQWASEFQQSQAHKAIAAGF
jgi:hypothetical protein